MTDHQNSFVLYLDNKEVFLSLDLETRGKLITAIFEYQESGIFPEDPLVKVAMSSFVAQFRRDGQKWQKAREEKTIAGKLGNLKRWHPQFYLEVVNKTKTLEEVECLLQSQGLSHTDRVGSDTIGQIANVAVSVSVSDSVSNEVKEDSLNQDNQAKSNIPAEQKDKSIPEIKEERKKKSGAQRKKKEFISPTLEQVKAYCAERKNNIDAKYFFDFYSVSDWRDSNGNDVKNWKQKVITWESKQGAKQEQTLTTQINQICGSDLILSTKETETEIKVFCKSPTAKSKLFDLNEETRNKIKALFGNKKFEFLS